MNFLESGDHDDDDVKVRLPRCPLGLWPDPRRRGNSRIARGGGRCRSSTRFQALVRGPISHEPNDHLVIMLYIDLLQIKP